MFIYLKITLYFLVTLLVFTVELWLVIESMPQSDLLKSCNQTFQKYWKIIDDFFGGEIIIYATFKVMKKQSIML